MSVGCIPRQKTEAVQTVYEGEERWEEVVEGSEDAFFVSRKWAGVGVGVFDGVGGWGESGVDSGEFSWNMSRKTKEAFERRGGGMTPTKALEEAYEGVQRDRGVAGGTTACVGQICSGTGRLLVTNLGDSGCSVYRDGRLFFASKTQTHFFNAPFQLSKVPDSLRKKEKSYLQNKVRDADEYNMYMKHGDLVVFATDGVLDNLFFKKIENIVTETLVEAKIWVKQGKEIVPTKEKITKEQLLSGMDISRQLVTSAKKVASDTEIDTPFAQEAKKHNYYYKGGKPDDAVALILLVLEMAHVAILPPPILFYVRESN
ncbi:type 2C protein phosphatase PTC7 [Pneumocystis jirovecii RU7]|uniref:Protein phosphatase n=1 Tax=Pneumocystis jirovecii (strain RU7) TaxID=1408657 RepID=A0A0W4ZEP1_PNEJ7|nr:type 2C protein phosphatase PTC7 [Pneumocystis jirovecii RU7]KTW26849.1 hypothetical protein T551_03311 [Pneumocystis jirovecii RU7]